MRIARSRFLACGHDRLGVQVEPETHQPLIVRWRPEMHTFYLPCGKYTITLEDVQLQLRLPVDGFAFIGLAQSTDWGAVCYDLLGAISNNIYGDQIEMS
ncbi:hypothetical protein J1N35_034911 [Gossypium stocksii]|uniref:Aminotransferase-like plant mobile domain-containing protein n=1 Tax=Gossypium stocksii TaxID=47602 RepID=A0A9D3UT92_9ROSI|nr:hypothetical protein J1N35_034911 [Gossypium stocksii]